jgi:hypothetical protein
MSASTGYNFNYQATAPTGTPSSIVEADKQQWLNALAAQLPSGDGKVTATNTGGSRKFDIEVQWSNCLGTLTTSDKSNCASGGNVLRTITFELRL